MYTYFRENLVGSMQIFFHSSTSVRSDIYIQRVDESREGEMNRNLIQTGEKRL